MTLRIVLPWQALSSSNQRNKRRGGRAHSEAYKQSRENMAMLAMGQVRDRPAFPDGPLAVKLRFYPPDFRRRDEMNMAKSLCDSLNGIAWRDDSQIRDVSVLRLEVSDEPRCEVTVSRWMSTEAA